MTIYFYSEFMGIAYEINLNYKRMVAKNITATFELGNVVYSMSRYSLIVSYVALTLD